MRQYVWVLVGFVGLALGCGSSVNVEQQRSALLAVDREWSQTTTDLSKFLSYYAADASVYPQGMPIATGSEAIRDAMTKMASMPGFSLQWSATKADVSASGDLGYTTGGGLAWWVYAPSRPGPGALSGGYGGASASATVGAGVSANALVGGLNNSISLQPFSVGAQGGLDAALTVSGMQLNWVAPHHKRVRKHRS